MTNAEKKQKIDKACDLLNEAAEKIKEAKKIFKECGIEFCGGFFEQKTEDLILIGCNQQLYAGIRTMEEILGKEAFHEKSYINGKTDTSVLFIKHKGLSFSQLGEEVTSREAKFSFR